MKICKLSAVCIEITRFLAKHKIYDNSYSLFTRPNDHLIIETSHTKRQEILDTLKTKYDIIENDAWCGGCRLGIIVPNMYEEIEVDN